jgi:hypothetical protein
VFVVQRDALCSFKVRGVGGAGGENWGARTAHSFPTYRSLASAHLRIRSTFRFTRTPRTSVQLPRRSARERGRPGRRGRRAGARRRLPPPTGRRPPPPRVRAAGGARNFRIIQKDIKREKETAIQKVGHPRHLRAREGGNCEGPASPAPRAAAGAAHSKRAIRRVLARGVTIAPEHAASTRARSSHCTGNFLALNVGCGEERRGENIKIASGTRADRCDIGNQTKTTNVGKISVSARARL